MTPIHKLKSIQSIWKVVKSLPDDLPAVVTGEGQDLDPVGGDETVLGIVPIELRKIFIASSEFANRYNALQVKKNSGLLTPEEKVKVALQSRIALRLAELTRDLAWAEVSSFLESLQKNLEACCHLREGWVISSGACTCPEHQSPQAATLGDAEQSETHAAFNAIVEEALMEGRLPDGIEVRPVPGGMALSMNREVIKEAVERKKREREQSVKPN